MSFLVFYVRGVFIKLLVILYFHSGFRLSIMFLSLVIGLKPVDKTRHSGMNVLPTSLTGLIHFQDLSLRLSLKTCFGSVNSFFNSILYLDAAVFYCCFTDKCTASLVLCWRVLLYLPDLEMLTKR